MRNRIASGMIAALSVFILSAAPVAADTAASSDLVAQANALISQITALQQQIGNSSSAGASSCPAFTRTLKSGMSGDDVSALQTFLARDTSVYPEGKVTGYFGSLTQLAVQRFQAKNGIASSGTPATTGYGLVGPRTMQAIVAACGGGSISIDGSTSGASVPAGTVGGFVQVSPISGSAPLGVQAIVTVNTAKSCSGATYVLDWGDRSSVQAITVPAGSCTQLAKNYSHIYQSGGAFKVSISSGNHGASAAISVGGSSGSIVPGGSSVSAQAMTPAVSQPVATALATPTMSQSSTNPLTVSMQFDLTGCPTFSLDWGDSTAPASGGGSCSTGSTSQLISHTYASAGSYTLRLLRGSQVDTAAIVLVQ